MSWAWNLFERFVYHYEYARHLRQHIEGLTWRKAYSYPFDHKDGSDPIEAAQSFLRKIRRR